MESLCHFQTVTCLPQNLLKHALSPVPSSKLIFPYMMHHEVCSKPFSINYALKWGFCFHTPSDNRLNIRRGTTGEIIGSFKVWFQNCSKGWNLGWWKARVNRSAVCRSSKKNYLLEPNRSAITNLPHHLNHVTFYSFPNLLPFYLNHSCRSDSTARGKWKLCQLSTHVFQAEDLGFRKSLGATEFEMYFNRPHCSHPNIMSKVDKR